MMSVLTSGAPFEAMAKLMRLRENRRNLCVNLVRVFGEMV